MAINTDIQNLINSDRKLSETDVDNLFYYFYGKAATSAEKSYWSKKTSKQLESALKLNAGQFKDTGYYKDVIEQQNQTSPDQSLTGGTPRLTPEQELQAAQDRIARGQGSPEDEANVAHAQEQGLLPFTGEASDGTSNGTDDGLTDDQKKAIEQGHGDIDAMIASGEITAAQGAVLHEIYSGEYSNKVPSVDEIKKIIEDATAAAEASLSPHYEQMEYKDIQDLKKQLSDIREQSSEYAAQEQMDYKQQLEQTKKSLRQRGLTFSGAGRKQLGAEGALQAKGVEGTLASGRRLTWEKRIGGQQRDTSGLLKDFERKWGTGGFQDSNFGSVWSPWGQQSLTPGSRERQQTGSMWQAKEAAIEQDMLRRLRNYSNY